MITLETITAFLDGYFGVAAFSGDPNGIYRSSSRPVRRIGLALEPWEKLTAWTERQALDALFLHRPWKFDLERLDANNASNGETEPLGVLAYHLAFDEKLTIGYNTRLADALGMTELEICGEKEGRPIGMLGQITSQSPAELRETADAIFGGRESFRPGQNETITKIAVIGAMTDALVREAFQRGAQAYITGQFREPARQAVTDTGMTIIEVGHRRSEIWGLWALAGVLRERWAELDVVIGE